MKRSTFLALAAAMTLPAIALPAAAADEESHFALGVKGGTTGIGITAQYKVNRFVVVHADADTLSFDKDLNSDGIHYDGKLKFSTFTAAVDLHPMANAFFLTAGVAGGARDADITATPTMVEIIGGVPYTPAQIGVITGKVELPKNPALLGLGYDNTLYGKGHWHVAVLAGVLLSDSPDVTLSSNGTYASLPQYQDSLRTQEKQTEDDLKQFKTYPVLSLTLGYRF